MLTTTGRPVLYMGGFGGHDPVIDAAGLAKMVANGELRYVLFGSSPGKQDIAQWLQTSCSIVPQFSRRDAPSSAQRPGKRQVMVLYRCE